MVSTLCYPVGACKMLPAVLHSQKHALFEEPPTVYLDFTLDQVGLQGLRQRCGNCGGAVQGKFRRCCDKLMQSVGPVCPQGRPSSTAAAFFDWRWF